MFDKIKKKLTKALAESKKVQEVDKQFLLHYTHAEQYALDRLAKTYGLSKSAVLRTLITAAFRDITKQED